MHQKHFLDFSGIVFALKIISGNYKIILSYRAEPTFRSLLMLPGLLRQPSLAHLLGPLRRCAGPSTRPPGRSGPSGPSWSPCPWRTRRAAAAMDSLACAPRSVAPRAPLKARPIPSVVRLPRLCSAAAPPPPQSRAAGRRRARCRSSLIRSVRDSSEQSVTTRSSARPSYTPTTVLRHHLAAEALPSLAARAGRRDLRRRQNSGRSRRFPSPVSSPARSPSPSLSVPRASRARRRPGRPSRRRPGPQSRRPPCPEEEEAPLFCIKTPRVSYNL